MRKRIYHRWFVVLGMLAMLGALVAMPMTSTFAMAVGAAYADQSSADEMPCHRPAKPAHCPNCPQKMCPDMGTCLAKCFQQLVPPLTGGMPLGLLVAAKLAPEPSAVAASSLVPPLLRPPSV